MRSLKRSAPQQNRPTSTGLTPHPPGSAAEPTAATAELAADLHMSAAELLARLTLLFAAQDAEAVRAAAQAADAAAIAQSRADLAERIASQPSPTERVAAIQRAQARLRADGVDPAHTLELIGLDRDQQGRQLDRRTAVLDDLLHGRSTGARFTVHHSDQ